MILTVRTRGIRGGGTVSEYNSVKLPKLFVVEV